MSVALVDVASMTTSRSVPMRESQMSIPVHSGGVFLAWDALTAEEKVTALERILRKAVDSATAAVLVD